MRLSLELESADTDRLETERLKCNGDDDDDDDDDECCRRTEIVPDSLSSSSASDVARSPTVVTVVRMVSADEPSTLSPSSVQRRSVTTSDAEAGAGVRKIGVAARFVTPCPTGRTKNSGTAAGQSRHHSDTRDRRRTTNTVHHQLSTSSGYSSSSSSSSTSSSSAAAVKSESLPDGYTRVARCLQSRHTSEQDVQRLVWNCRQLNDCEFYVPELTSTDAKRLLHRSAPGTFLVRDSARPDHLYSLTVKTQRGVTSIRTVYNVHGFRLDSDPQQVCPSFFSSSSFKVFK